MIPGNRPEDIAEEEFWATLEEKLQEKHNLDVEDEFWNADWFQTAIAMARDLGYERGFGEGRQEEQMAQAHKEETEYERRQEIEAMKEAHSEGLHDDAPREFCPYCDETRRGTRD